MDHWIDLNRNDRLMPCQTSTEESTSTESTKNHIYKRCRRRRTASIIPCATNLSKKLQSSPFTSFHLTLFAFALISTTITIISTNANGFDAAKKGRFRQKELFLFIYLFIVDGHTSFTLMIVRLEFQFILPYYYYYYY